MGLKFSKLSPPTNFSDKIDSSYKKHPKKWDNPICYGYANQAFRKDAKLPSGDKAQVGRIVDNGYGPEYSKLMNVSGNRRQQFDSANVRESGFVNFMNNKQSRNDGVFHTGYLQKENGRVDLYHANAMDLDAALIGKDKLKQSGPFTVYDLSDKTKQASLNNWMGKNDYSYSHTPNSQLPSNLSQPSGVKF